MKTNKIFGLLVALTLSTQVLAYGQHDFPPFDSFTCQAESINIQVKVQHYRQTSGAGPAAIYAGGETWSGGWTWAAADEGTRLTGYHYLTVKAHAQNSLGPIYLHTLYSPYGELSGGWFELTGTSGSIDCKIDEAIKTANQCKVPPGNNCSVSPKRLCCDCVNGQLSCY